MTSCLSDGQWSKDTNVTYKGQLLFLVASSTILGKRTLIYRILSILTISQVQIMASVLCGFGLRLPLFPACSLKSGSSMTLLTNTQCMVPWETVTFVFPRVLVFPGDEVEGNIKVQLFKARLN